VYSVQYTVHMPDRNTLPLTRGTIA
jgi:hypothetical protein